MYDPKNISENRLDRLAEEIASLHPSNPLSQRSTWSNMAVILLDGRFGMRWNRDVFNEVFSRMSETVRFCQSGNIDAFLTYVFTSFQTFRQLLPSLDILWSGGLNALTRTRMLTIPAYTTLLEGCYSNLSKAIFVLLSKQTGKDYATQNYLGPIAEVLRSNSFPLLAGIVNTNLRNAINHGGINIVNASSNAVCEINYTYTEHGERFHKSMSSSELQSELFELADSLRGALLGLLAVIDVQDSCQWPDYVKDEYIRLMYKGFALGNAKRWCLDASAVEANPQVNFTFETKDTSQERLYTDAERIFVEAYESFPDYSRYCVTFSNPRLAANFLRIGRKEIEEFKAAGEKPWQLIKTIMSQGEWMWFEPSDEDVSLEEAMFYRFPFYDDDSMSIFDIEDVSTEDRKRLKANVFTHLKQERDEVIPIALFAVEWVKTLRNPPTATMRVKHGDMKADCVYLNIYKDELDRNRSLDEANKNFICQVEYCPNAEFRLTGKNGFIAYIYNNAEWVKPDTKFLWRDRGNLTQRNRNKVGRNDPCPCGSGMKYKKCCGAV